MTCFAIIFCQVEVRKNMMAFFFTICPELFYILSDRKPSGAEACFSPHFASKGKCQSWADPLLCGNTDEFGRNCCPPLAALTQTAEYLLS